MPSCRILVVGDDILTVQQVSRYCLNWSNEVLPVFGPPNEQDVALFAPHIAVICQPLSADWQPSLPVLVWSNAPGEISSRAALEAALSELCRA